MPAAGTLKEPARVLMGSLNLLVLVGLPPTRVLPGA